VTANVFTTLTSFEKGKKNKIKKMDPHFLLRLHLSGTVWPINGRFGSQRVITDIFQRIKIFISPYKNIEVNFIKK
jgi:hypothetical protein